jgi:hypothetical protein
MLLTRGGGPGWFIIGIYFSRKFYKDKYDIFNTQLQTKAIGMRFFYLIRIHLIKIFQIPPKSNPQYYYRTL